MEESVTTYLIKLGELTLKGGNSKTFEKKLFFNAKKIYGKLTAGDKLYPITEGFLLNVLETLLKKKKSNGHWTN